MNKDKLQQELLEKIKPGTKPSDLKRPKKNIKSKPLKDEGYSSEEEKIPQAPPLPNQNLQAQITSLKKQLQVYQDFKEADLKIKERYKETIAELQAQNQELNKTIETMKNQSEPKENKPEPLKTFLCSECNQTKPQTELSRVFGSFSFCLNCSKKARKEAQKEKETKAQVEEFICHLCSKGKKEVPVRMKLDSTLTEYLVCQECRPQAKEFNEADLITDDLWIKYPYSSASEILELEFGIKKNHD